MMVAPSSSSHPVVPHSVAIPPRSYEMSAARIQGGYGYGNAGLRYVYATEDAGWATIRPEQIEPLACKLKTLLEVCDGASILSVACGNGFVERALAYYGVPFILTDSGKSQSVRPYVHCMSAADASSSYSHRADILFVSYPPMVGEIGTDDVAIDATGARWCAQQDKFKYIVYTDFSGMFDDDPDTATPFVTYLMSEYRAIDQFECKCWHDLLDVCVVYERKQ
jgi:hypothetical protein